MSDLAAYLGAAVLVALAAWAFAIERRGAGHPVRWAALAFTLAEGCSLALLAPRSVQLLGRTGMDGLSVIALGDTVRTVALSLLMLLACLLNQRPTRRLSAAVQAAIAVSMQAAMVLLFVAARPSLDGAGSLVAGHGRWELALRVALFAGYAVWALAELFLALLPQARTAATGPLRWGVRLLLAAIGLGVVWTLWSYDDFVRVLRHGRLDGSEDTVSNLLGAACATLVVTAALVGKSSATLEAAARRLRLWRCYFAMGPLWSALRRAMPEIAFPSGGRPLLRVRPAGIEFALYRRVIEIHDGRLVLRAYRHPAVAAWLAQDAADGADGPDAALVEAATIAAALENLRRGRRFPAVGGEAAAPPDADFVPADLDAEVQWLSRVAVAFRRSPAIPALLERLRQEEE